jgi:hypothetical protein
MGDSGDLRAKKLDNALELVHDVDPGYLGLGHGHRAVDRGNSLSTSGSRNRGGSLNSIPEKQDLGENNIPIDIEI